MRFLLTACLLAFGPVTELAACSCAGPPPPKKAMEVATAVFLGEAVKVEVEGETRTVTFKVDRWWKGGDKQEVVAATHKSGATCGYGFEKGKKYLVYAHQDEKQKTLHVSLCSRTRTEKEAEQSGDFKELGEGKAPITLAMRNDLYHAYWLITKGEGEYLKLLVTRWPIENLNGYKALSVLPFDNVAMTFQTYKRDSLWGNPFVCVKQFGAVDTTAKSVVVDGTTYNYDLCPLKDVINLFEKPEGTVKIHRREHPLAGAEQTAKAFLALLKEQQKAEK